jgi:hypothetical protein
MSKVLEFRGALRGFKADANATRCSVLKSRPEVEMYATPQEVWAAFVAISAGGCVILLGYIISKWRK